MAGGTVVAGPRTQAAADQDTEAEEPGMFDGHSSGGNLRLTTEPEHEGPAARGQDATEADQAGSSQAAVAALRKG